MFVQEQATMMEQFVWSLEDIYIILGRLKVLEKTLQMHLVRFTYNIS